MLSLSVCAVTGVILALVLKSTGIKALLALMNKAQDVVRLPLTPVTQPTRDTLAAALAAISRG